MLPVLMLFLIPVGGGIPAGVLLAHKTGLHWALTAFLYLVSDVILAFAFEPVLRLLSAVCRRYEPLARFGAAFKLLMDRQAAAYGAGAGPFMLVMIAFGVDPMTGRAAALAAGHGFVTGWIIAITGDMMYYGVVAAATLKLGALIGDPAQTTALVLLAMFMIPAVIRKLKASWSARATAA